MLAVKLGHEVLKVAKAHDRPGEDLPLLQKRGEVFQVRLILLPCAGCEIAGRHIDLSKLVKPSLKV